jgi:putative tryptophan/tyrosine transport system substrate-binding protein
VKRRTFIAGLGSAAAWPVVARAQQGERVRRIGVLSALAPDDPIWPLRFETFQQRLQDLGWVEGRNIRFDVRWAAGNAERYRNYAEELVSLGPDVLVGTNGPSLAALLQATRTVPIVFASVIDPVGGGWVRSLNRPGGNATGFLAYEFGMSVKSLELLKQISPRLSRAAVIRDPTSPAGTGQLGALQGASPFFGIELVTIDARYPAEIERAIAEFAQTANGGLIVTLAAPTVIYRGLIIQLAARHRLPAIYPYRDFVTDGGLASYGATPIQQYHLAAGYVDRVLKGEKPADLPVQAPTRYETVINLRTAKTLDLTIPETLLATADELIQ